jgi:hypothetical protein
MDQLFAINYYCSDLFDVNNNNLLQLLPFYCLPSWQIVCSTHMECNHPMHMFFLQLHEIWKGDQIKEFEIRSSDFVTFLQTAFTKSGICKALPSFVVVVVVVVLHPHFMALLCLQGVQMLQNESVGRRMNFTKHFPRI